MKPEAPALAVSAEEKLALARKAFVEFRTRCFWFMRPGFIPTSDDIPRIADGLRHYGGRAGWMLAASLCQ